MNKERLKEFRHIEAALKTIRKDIKRCSKCIEQSTGTIVHDVTLGSSPEFPYIARHYQISGVDTSSRDKYLKILRRREADFNDKILEFEEWLEGIEDPLEYNILRLKVKNNLTDGQIGAELGYSRSRITQLINAYLSLDKD